MENQGRHSPESNETDTSAADQSSRNPYQERNDCGNYTTRRNDTIATQSSSLTSCSNIVEITSDDDEQIVEIEGTPPKQENEHPQSSSQMDVSCPVCLSEYDNKAFLDKCFHAFCYFCILQWSEIVRTCPLCKSSFNSIIHSVKSMTDYQQHYLKDTCMAPTLSQSQNDGRRFRFRSTQTNVRRQQQETRRQWGVSDSLARGQQAHHSQARFFAQRNRGVANRERRRAIYSSNMWVQRVDQDGRRRQRDISPEFFRMNPACTHRLIPWITRDLSVLLSDEESHVGFVLQIILSLITKVELRSEEFYHQLRPFLFEKTEHFIHEFISFARSPFDLNTYDQHAQYSWYHESQTDPVRDTPTVFHSSTTDWQSPLPGPSEVSHLELSQVEWNADSPLRTNDTSWSPTSSPGTTSLNAPIVTISSSSSHSISTAHIRTEVNVNNASISTAKSYTRTSPSKLGTRNVDDVRKSRRTRSHRHHEQSHKYRRKQKKRVESEHRSKIHAHSSDRDLNIPGPSNPVSVDSSVSSKSIEIIWLSDSSISRNSYDTISGRSASTDKRLRIRSRSRSKNRDSRKSRPRSLSSSSGNWNINQQSRSISGYLKSNSRKHYPSDSEKSRDRQSRYRSKSKREKSPSHSKPCYKDLTRKEESRINRSRSRSSSRSHSRSKRKLHSRNSSKYFRSKRHRTRSRERNPSSSSRVSESRLSESRHRVHTVDHFTGSGSSTSSLPKQAARSPNSRHELCCRSSSRDKESELKGEIPCGTEDIKREIEDLEHRIAVDKKRLLQLLIKQEKSKGGESTEDGCGEQDDC
ncbi:E3 ubiquitin-protein ligase Topors-like [Acropora muricata]|uniref:E3 ubiquitin-protein ligase Topors-like n=1 Tax=Acropora muricata TaxID=159855 RepID=UPI0034E4DAD0